MSDRIEGKWIDCFQRTFQLCKIAPDDAVAILSDAQSRPINVELAELALQRSERGPSMLWWPRRNLKVPRRPGRP